MAWRLNHHQTGEDGKWESIIIPSAILRMISDAV